MDVLMFTERIKTAIELGESHFREFKSCFEGKPDAKTKRKPQDVAIDIGRTLVAFANADGGELLVGVEDDGTITGHDFNQGTIDKLLGATKTQIKAETPLKSYTAKVIKIDNIEILYFQVEKSTEYIHQTSDGRVLVRSDKQSIPREIEKINFERQEQISLQCDRQFVDGALIVDLDLDLIKYVSSSIANGISEEKCLQFLDLAEYTTSGLKLRRASLLLFAKEINKWHARCGIRIARIIGNELKTGLEYNVKDDIIISDNILKLINKSWERLRPHLAVHKYFSDGRFRESIIYPEEACREALINAIAHRDYSIEGRFIEIFVYDDKMEIKSPGGLLSNIKIDDLKKLKGTHQSRNSKISRVLRETGSMKEMGEGMRRIYQLMQGNELSQPEISSDFSNFSIILNNKSVYNEEDQLLLDSYKNFNLSSEERLVMLLGKNSKTLTLDNIKSHLGLKDAEITNLIITKLRVKGLITLTENNKNPHKKKYIISKANDVELYLVELKEALCKTTPTPIIDNEFIKKLKVNLNSNNLYKQNNLLNVLKNFGYIDEDHIPTKELIILWPEYKNHDVEQVINNLNNNTSTVEVVLESSISILKEKKAFINLSEFEKIIKNNLPTFSPLNYGYGSLVEYLKSSKLISTTGEKNYIKIAYDLKNQSEIIRNETTIKDFKTIFISIYKKMTKTKDDWVYFGQFASEIKKDYPEFNSIDYGFRRLTDMLKALPDVFEYKYESDRTELFLRLIASNTKEASKDFKIPQLLSVPTSLLIEAYEKTKDKEDWASLASMGFLLKKLYPGFNAKNYGYNSMSELYESQSDIFEIRKEFSNNSNQALIYVKQKNKASAKSNLQIPKKQIALPLTNIKSAFDSSNTSEDGWVKITMFYEQLQKIEKFSSLTYGYNNFYDFIINNATLFEIKNGIANEPFDIELKLLFN